MLARPADVSAGGGQQSVADQNATAKNVDASARCPGAVPVGNAANAMHPAQLRLARAGSREPGLLQSPPGAVP
jgi:hypothetical protein